MVCSSPKEKVTLTTVASLVGEHSVLTPGLGTGLWYVKYLYVTLAYYSNVTLSQRCSLTR